MPVGPSLRRRLVIVPVLATVVLTVAAADRPPSHDAPEFPGFRQVPVEREALAFDQPFSTSIHVELVEQDPQSLACSETLAAAQWRQDLLLALDATAHYDNCEFDRTTRYVHRLFAEALAAGKDSDSSAALDRLGRALHAIQDFYSHSNYIEMTSAASQTVDDIPVVRVWRADGQKALDQLAAKGLVSGDVWWERGGACRQPALKHEDLNKDSAKTKSGAVIVKKWGLSQYQIARSVALRATRAFLRDAFDRPELLKIGDQCKQKIAFLVLVDQRR